MKRFTTTLLLFVFCIMLVGCGKSREEQLIDEAMEDYDKALKDAERLMDKY